MDDVTKTDKMLARKDGRVGYVIFNNPERLNAVSLDMWAATAHILDDFAKDDERLVYDTVCELLETKRLSDETFARAHQALGTDKLIELVTAVGFYMTAAAMVNAFDVGPRHEGKRLA